MKHWTFFLVIAWILTVLSCTASSSAGRRAPVVQHPPLEVQAAPAVEPSSASQPAPAAEESEPAPAVQPEPVEQETVPVEQAPPAEQPAAEPLPAEPPAAPQPEPEPVVETPPAEPQPEPAPAEPVVVEAEPEAPVFTVTQEVFDTAKADIQQLVQDLNRIIRAQDFNTWLTYLSDDYRNKVNSKEFLDDIKARYPVFRNRINNARDYFRNVIVPSRANDRVDDIEFRSENRVTAYTVNNQGTRLRLYDLEDFNGSWKLILVED